MKSLCLGLLLAVSLNAREPLVERIAHTEPARFQTVPGVHAGAGEIGYQVLIDSHTLETNLHFLHTGVLAPKSSIGHHFHNNSEEMYIILDGEAEFTVDGRTSVLKGPAGAPCRLGHSHALYNHTDRPVRFLNVNVSMVRGESEAFNLDDTRVGAPLDAIPVFMTMRLDGALLRPVKGMNGGKGEVQYRRALGPSVFEGPWAYVDHLVLPPGTSVGQQAHRGVAEVYYVMGGSGTVTVSSQGHSAETAAIGEGDAVPIQLLEVHSFENTGEAPLEMMIVGVARGLVKETN